MNITSSANIKSFSKGQSYKQLKDKHFDAKDREEKGISKNKEFEKLNMHFGDSEKNHKFVERVYQGFNEAIEEYNNKPSQKKHKSRQYKDLDDYVEKRKSHKRINKDFHGLEYMMVSKLGSMESWQQVVDEFENHGVNEEDTLNCLNEAFRGFANYFNKSFHSHGLDLVEADTNLDEIGAPHMHARVILNRRLENGLPDTNLANALKSKYGKCNNRELMAKFRFDLDNSLVEKSSEALKNLAKERGFEYEGLNLVRLEAEEVGLTHEAYKQKQEMKRQRKELKQRRKTLDFREDYISSREALLDERDIKVSQREKEASEMQQRASEAIQDAESISDNLKHLEEQLKAESLTSEQQLVDYISEPFKEYKGAYNDIWNRANDYWQHGKFKTITKQRKHRDEEIERLSQWWYEEDKQQKDDDIEYDF